MPRIHLTDKTVRSLKPSDKQEDYWDTVMSGLLVRVSPGGKKSFYVVYRNAQAQRRRTALGDCSHLSLSEARTRAKDLMGEVARGEDPARAKQEYRKTETFAELCRDFMRFHVEPNLRERSAREANYLIERELKPRWGRWKAADVRRRDVIRLIDELAVDRGRQVYANRVRALVSSIFSFGLRREIVDTSPCVGLPKKFKERPRVRVLSDDEIRAFWRAGEEEDPVIRDLFRLLLLLGQRSGETKAMEWSHIRNGVWYIPPALTKNAREQAVPLPSFVLEMLAAHRASGHSGVFVVRGASSIQWIQKAKCRIAQRMNSLENWTAHDLRRTCASGLEKLGISEAVVASVLNHSKESRHGITAVYTRHRYLEEKRQALEAWCDHVLRVVEEDAKTMALAG